MPFHVHHEKIVIYYLNLSRMACTSNAKYHLRTYVRLSKHFLVAIAGKQIHRRLRKGLSAFGAGCRHHIFGK